MDDLRSIVNRLDHCSGIYLPTLPVGTVIRFKTDNSIYQLILRAQPDCQVEARGGYFRLRAKEPCCLSVIGSTLGGSAIYRGFLVKGLFCEFEHRILTTAIREISISLPN